MIIQFLSINCFYSCYFYFYFLFLYKKGDKDLFKKVHKSPFEMSGGKKVFFNLLLLLLCCYLYARIFLRFIDFIKF